MANFYASISGKAVTEATRTGTKTSGISGHIRGWDSGVKVVGVVDENGEDIFYVYATTGSKGSGSDSLVAIVNDKGYTTANFYASIKEKE